MKLNTTIGRGEFFSQLSIKNLQPMDALQSERHIWTFYYDDTGWENAFDFLSPEEKEYSKSLLFLTRRREFIISRAVLRQLLSFYLKEQPSNIIFGKREKGKPFLEYPRCALEFNLSHCENTIAIGISRQGAIGIDIENSINLLEDCHSMAGKFFTPKEAQWIKDGKAETCSKRFLAIFAQKEAFVKCSGDGMSKPFNSFEVPLLLNPFTSQFMMLEKVGNAQDIFLAVCCEQKTSAWHLFKVY